MRNASSREGRIVPPARASEGVVVIGVGSRRGERLEEEEAEEGDEEEDDEEEEEEGGNA